MPAESSFDIVSRINRQEVDNALNQAAKEIGTRFDFRGVGASITWSGKEAVEIKANSEERANAVLDVFKEKLIKRSVSLKVLDAGEPKLSGKDYRLHVGLKEGISQDEARKISKIIRDAAIGIHVKKMLPESPGEKPTGDGEILVMGACQLGAVLLRFVEARRSGRNRVSRRQARPS